MSRAEQVTAMAQSPAAAAILQQFMSEEELREVTGRTVRTLRIWRRRRTGPAWTLMGRKILYRRTSVEKWLLDNEVQPRSRKKAAR